MKFITEMDLYDTYHKTPFLEYKIEQGAKLTPGARQFLLDHGVTFERPICKQSTQPLPNPKQEEKSARQQGESTEALFLLVASQLLDGDVLLAQKVFGMAAQYRRMMADDIVEPLPAVHCTGINPETFGQPLDCCFPLTEFHIQLPKGKEIALLHYLRSLLLEQPECEPINQIINTLNHSICQLVGGSECQR